VVYVGATGRGEGELGQGQDNSKESNGLVPSVSGAFVEGRDEVNNHLGRNIANTKPVPVEIIQSTLPLLPNSFNALYRIQ
jgi:hypothetical protein